MDEFHDFVVDVGLETKQYKFDVMCNQFIKANATNSAQVRAQRQDEKRDAQGRGNDAPDWQRKKVEKLKGTSSLSSFFTSTYGSLAYGRVRTLYSFFAWLFFTTGNAKSCSNNPC